MKTYIYILVDPITNQIRYIGKSNNPFQRFKNHKNRCRDKNTHKRNWINKLRLKGVNPEIEVIDTVDIKDWKYWEKFWIQYFKSIGCNLTNNCDGGEGLTFANRTSFKKGHKPWNTGTAKPKIKKGFNAKSLETSFRKGHKSWNKGKQGYKLAGEKTSYIVEQYDLDGNYIKEHLGCKEASIEVGCIPENIRRCCVGLSKSARKFIWKYKNKN